MRKRRAIMLFGGFTVLLLAYFAWCASPFFLEPKFVFYDDTPPDAKAVIREWRPYQSLPPAGEFFPEIMRNLANPYAVNRVEARVYYHNENNLHLAAWQCSFVASAKRKNGKWKLGPFDPIIIE